MVIGIVMGIALAACSPSVKVPEPVEGPSLELSSIDSLMWRQPDSAYAMLKEFVVSPEAKELDAFNGHYCQLLISELLYKNDWGQSNRGELLKAVGYFDSIVDLHGEDVQKRNAFLDARAHYINGVGFYEQDDLVNACAEYLKTLEVMEKHFEEKELVEHKARFLAYTYNRLGDMFSEQFMMESAIKCYESALFYCKIEPTSSSGISNVLYRIGKQYDKKGEKSKAHEYYTMALEKMPSRNNLLFRDLVSTKALCEYKLGYSHKQSLDKLKQVLMLADNESEHLFRFLIIGGIYYEEKVLDSALYYLEPVFKNDVDIGLRAEAANTLRTIYESIGDEENANSCISFLVENKKLDWENKSLVSKLEGMYKTYMDQKQQKEADEEREMSIRKTIEIFVPIAIIMALAVFIVVKLRSKKLLKDQQEEADRILGETEQEHEKELRLWQAEADKTLEETKKRYEEELRQLKADTEQQLEEVERKHQQWMAKTKERHEEELRAQKDQSEKEIEKTKKRHEKELATERLAYQMEQEALRRNIQQREAQVSALEKVLEQQSEEATKQRAAFLDEEICQRILDLLHGKHITSRDTSFQHGIGLKEEDFKQLKDAVERHYKGFDNILLSQCASLKQSDLTLCHLHLLGLNEGEIGALKDRTYSAIKKQNESLQEKLGIVDDVAAYVLRVAEGLCVPQDVPQGVSHDVTQEITQAILGIIAHNPKITREEMAHQLGVSSKTVGRYLKKLDGRVRYVGSGYSGHWEVMD